MWFCYNFGVKILNNSKRMLAGLKSEKFKINPEVFFEFWMIYYSVYILYDYAQQCDESHLEKLQTA